MNLTTQLRIILLLVGAATWLGIYLMGKRRAALRMSVDSSDRDEPLTQDTTAVFASPDELDEEQLETPAYMRRQGQREPRQDYEPRIANVHDYDDVEAAHHGGQQLVDIAVHSPRREVAATHEDIRAPMAGAESTTAEPIYTDYVYTRPAHTEIAAPEFEVRYEPHVSLDDSLEVSATAELHLPATSLPDFNVLEPVPAATLIHVAQLPESEVMESSAIPVMAEPVATSYQAPQRSPEPDVVSPATPTLSDVVRKPVQPETPAPTTATTKSSGSTVARRKIIALRLPMPERVPGSQLLSLLQREQLQHGKFGIFHRLHAADSVFSVASMVEPGAFDTHTMAEQQFPGVTLFMLLPGPLDGLVAYDQMMSCAQRLAHATGGTLQDERGSKLTTQSMDRLRDEVLDFQHLLGGVITAH